MSIQDDRRELLKLKQGLVSEEESQLIPQKKDSEPEEKLTGGKWLENFLYHHKFKLIVIVFFLIVGIFLFEDFITSETAEFRAIVVADNDDTANTLMFRYDQLELAMETFASDANNDENVHVETFFIDIRETNDANMYMVGTTKLHGEFAQGKSAVYIGNKHFFENNFASVGEENAFINLEELFPDNPNVNGLYYQLYDSPLAKAAGWTASCPKDLYLGIRKPFEDMMADEEELLLYTQRALEMLTNAIHEVKP